jgi:hypothetical protein
MGAPASCLFWGAYESFKYHYRHTAGLQNEMLINFLSGMSAECVSCVLWLPIDIIKERQQVEAVIKKYHYKNSIDAIRQITQHEGILGLYRAYGATVMSFGPLLGVNLMLYERLKTMFGYGSGGKGADIPFVTSFSIAMISGTVASLLTNPLDLVKVRMQVQRVEMSLRDDKQLEKGRFGYRNVFHGISQAIQNEGALSLWKGCGSRILHMALQAAINLSLLEKVRAAIIKRYQR